MEENKETNRKELFERVDTVRSCFRTIVELGRKGSIKERAFTTFFIALGMDEVNKLLEEMSDLLDSEEVKKELRDEKNSLS